MLLYLVVYILRIIFEFRSCIFALFSLAEQKKIEQAALSNKKRKFIGIVICIYSGLRIGELLALALLHPNKEKPNNKQSQHLMLLIS